KIRNRLQDMGESIFVQSNDRRNDEFDSLRERADSNEELKKVTSQKKVSEEDCIKVACEQWMYVRSFGQVFAFKGTGGAAGVSVCVLRSVSIHTATCVKPIDSSSMQIAKSVDTDSC